MGIDLPITIAHKEWGLNFLCPSIYRDSWEMVVKTSEVRNDEQK